MELQKKVSKCNIDIVKHIIRTQQRLLETNLIKDKPETQAILHQMIHGKPQHKPIKLYKYLLEEFLLAGGGDQSNLAYYAKQQHKPTYNRVNKPWKRLNARN